MSVAVWSWRADPFWKVLSLDIIRNREMAENCTKSRKFNYTGGSSTPLKSNGYRKCYEEQREVCPRCDVRVTRKEKSIQCDGCLKWHHTYCESMDDETYEWMSKGHDSILWPCRKCRPEMKCGGGMLNVRKENEEMRREVKEARKINEEISKRINEMQASNTSVAKAPQDNDTRNEINMMKEALKETREKFDQMEQKLMNREKEIVEEVTARVLGEMREKEDRQRRKNNVVMFNAQESDREYGIERQTEDRKVCEQIIKEKLNVEGAEVVKVYRVGKRTAGRCRPMVVVLNDETSKWRIVKKGNELKNGNGNEMKITIDVDRTRREREEDAKLRQQLLEKRNEGGRWIIRRKKIIRVLENQESQ